MSDLVNIEMLVRDVLANSVGSGADPIVGRWVGGRIVAVLGSPSDGSTTNLAYGVSVLPAGSVTEAHSHEAEELAIVLMGRGVIAVGERELSIVQGDLVVASPFYPHWTRASDDVDLAVLWVYAPAGSEKKWLAPPM